MRVISSGGHRFLVWSLVTLSLAVLAGCTGPGEAPAPTAPVPTVIPTSASQEVGTSAEAIHSAPPAWFAQLTPDQKLDHVLSLPGIQGFVHGVTGAPRVNSIQLGGPSSMSFNVTDVPFTISGFVGRDPSPYAIGAKITVRFPGGTSGTLQSQAEDAPTPPAAGQELYVAVRNHGASNPLGTDSSTLLLAPDASDFFLVQGGLVHGNDAYVTLAEPPLVFEQHFRAQSLPAASPVPVSRGGATPQH